QRHQGVAGNKVGVAFHPLVVGVGPAAVGVLALGDRLQQLGAPVVLLAVGRGDFVHAHRVEALGHAVVIVEQAALLAGGRHARVGVHAVVLLDPLESFLDARIIFRGAAVDQALDAGVGHAAVADQVTGVVLDLGLAAACGAVDETAVVDLA